MNKLNLIFLIGFLLLTTVKLFSEDLYDLDSITDIEIIFEQDNWDQILDNYCLSGNNERLIGSVIINGNEFDSVGIRYKGNSSYNQNRVKNPLNIKLDYVIDDQTYDGYGTLKLSNGFKDPSFVREVLSYEIARKYMPASKANYASVKINDQNIGIYTSVQSVDKYFLRNNFDSDENAFFKGELQGAIPELTASWGYYGTDSTNYFNYYEIESDSGWNDLINFLNILNNDITQIENVLNIDNHLWMLALDNLLVNLDAPINYAHNFYLYEDDDGRFNPILWDLNESFGVFTRLFLDNNNLSFEELKNLDPFLYDQSESYPLISQILSNEYYKKMYVAHMKTIIDDNFSNNWYFNEAQNLQNRINTEILNDDNMLYSYSYFLNNVENNVGFGPQQIIGITELMNDRIEFLENEPYFAATQPEFIENNYNPQTIQPNSTLNFNVRIENTNLVYLYIRQGFSRVFEKHEMDNIGNDEYSIDLSINVGDIEYYFCAFNENSCKFSPVRAAYEFYTIDVTDMETEDIVINEFLASNDNISADQDGEFDDWIELYNNSENDVNLAGYFLSDDPQNLSMWEFPEVTIDAGGFLIIWADNDPEQEGLHTNFKLSASADSIIFSAPDLSIIDQIGYESQVTDISTGRYPDGSNEYFTMIPSYNTANTINYGESNLVINEFLAINDSLFFDSAGESDDWIEFYNDSNSAISLEGYYLSDQSSLLTKWTFPAIVLNPNNYLIVWLDNDIDQEGLHGNFKLSGTGETIYLTTPELAIIEAINYPEQSPNVSYGRWPNANGEFRFMYPSPETTNYENVSENDIFSNNVNQVVLYNSYPNPFNNKNTRQNITFSYILNKLSFVDLEIYNIKGQKIKTLVSKKQEKGLHIINWNGNDDYNQKLQSGIYFYKLNSNNYQCTKKLTIIN